MALNIRNAYLTLEEAAEVLGEAEIRLIRAAGNGDVQLCVNIYGRARSQSMTRMQVDWSGSEAELAQLETDERQRIGDVAFDSHAQRHNAWIARCTSPMPDGIYEIGEDAARFMEMAGDRGMELFEGFKLDDLGWWQVDFADPVAICRKDVVLLSEEVDRLRRPIGTQQEKLLDGRERATLLNIIGALADAANLDLSRHNKAGDTVAAMLDAQGVRLSGRTIGEHLKAVREAMDSRKVK